MPGRKFVFSFGRGKADGRAGDRVLLGGKGANLHEMTRLGLPVPPGFTISTDVCDYFYRHLKTYPVSLKKEVSRALAKLERVMDLQLGNPERPLLVSVRSGARASMPGMMDTILNLGMNDAVAESLSLRLNDERFVYDSYRRLIAMYADVVLGLDKNIFEEALEKLKRERGVTRDSQLTAPAYKTLTAQFKSLVRRHTQREFPQDSQEQLWGAMGAVFGSWMNPRAITYRKLNRIPESWGTAVNVQAMVFGNRGGASATGVAFTRDPSTGKKRFFGEFLPNAQGEDVVAGIRTPQPINQQSKNGSNGHSPTLENLMPKAYAELVKIRSLLENHYRDMQDIEFTIQEGTLYLLQCRNGKRTAAAAIKIAVDMAHEGLITKEESLQRVTPAQFEQLLHPRLDTQAKKNVVARGLPASPGAACGQIVFDPTTAFEWSQNLKRRVILVRPETSPEDIHGMHAAEGILTARGGMTSHAAVVARGMGKCCVAGCNDLTVSLNHREMVLGGRVFKEGDYLTLDGGTGEIMTGAVATIEPSLTKDIEEFLSWADQIRALRIRANADTPHDARIARTFGAEGIGLCRTEHMFFDSDRIDTVREMILADDPEGRQRALEKIMPMQKKDFMGIFREMKGLPVTIRLLDPPLHEFLPQKEEEIRRLAAKIGIPEEKLRRKAESLKEFNPMLGHRGCRLGISFPDIYIVQVRAVMEAACELIRDEGIDLFPEIMIPLVAHEKELKIIKDYIEQENKAVLARYKVHIPYTIGTMIELPRAALTADQIARHAEFFSFGTNDLTQTAYGLSRDDSAVFLDSYQERGIFDKDPFVTLDQEGVGSLINTACRLGRLTRPTIKHGNCGEHGGDPDTIAFCPNKGHHYVSCSPIRDPIARLAAAHAALASKKLKILLNQKSPARRRLKNNGQMTARRNNILTG
ncbi:MAG: pyruvate, phosphate dikinase [Elusimicrobia bacterium]|nr:pyruvate, phosphate dikinase [Elusimicrobiota bacterium]